MVGADDVLTFWLDKHGPKDWYKSDAVLDAAIRERFEAAWESAGTAGYSMWLTYPNGSLAYIILTDQFPRNMFRDDPRAFSTDRQALAAAKSAIDRQWDLRVDEPARQFFYMPLMHSENLCDQERCVRLIFERMPKGGADNLLHARAHREVIRRFGRFPHRNAALRRATTGPEQAFLSGGGYGGIVRDLQADAAA